MRHRSSRLRCIWKQVGFLQKKFKNIRMRSYVYSIHLVDQLDMICVHCTYSTGTSVGIDMYGGNKDGPGSRW